ncbi:MAG TPA: ferritin family protein [Spirochaetota bacterium]|nr:ferritin family protein [Spirochaetota bacterium]HOD16653.1 ferritin family protein [Spirochaetota bacterium]HPG52708.1 ferritin family protein [Spirochaetota bacterium]HQL84112.1 ferritin family protein [Spirochaetota bacterium]
MAYSIKEIIDIAIKLEDTGHDFYKECGRHFKEPAVIDVFSFLAREELVHRDLFQSFQWRPDAVDEGIFNDDYYAYLRAVGGGLVFDRHTSNIRDFVRAIETPLDAIKHAFIAEKESILLYKEMKRLYPKHHATADMLERIIAEERKHVLTLYDLADKLKKT